MQYEGLTPSQLYQIGMLARHAFMAGRGRGKNDRLTDDDLMAFRMFCETSGFDVLLKRIAREAQNGGSTCKT